jgi:hypothetical protein
MPQKNVTIKVVSPKVGRELSVVVSCLFDTLKEDIQAQGEGPIKAKYDSQVLTDVGNSVRGLLTKGATDADILAYAKAYKPGVTQRVAVDSHAAFLGKFKSMSKEEQLAELENLKALIAAKK